MLCSRMSPPWSLRIEDQAPLTLVAVVRGEAWLEAGGSPRQVGCGDVAILRGPALYTVADEPGRPAQAVILPGHQCVAPDGGAQTAMGDLGVRTWGNDATGGTELLTGTYPVPREVSPAPAACAAAAAGAAR
jgi:Cupin